MMKIKKNAKKYFRSLKTPAIIETKNLNPSYILKKKNSFINERKINDNKPDPNAFIFSLTHQTRHLQ